MNSFYFRLPRLGACLLGAALTTAAWAQDSVESIPKNDPPFNGKVAESVEASTPDFPIPLTAPAGAPNVLIVLLDDAGFGMTSTFGGPVPTPTFDRLAAEGLEYTQFHTTALCSPSRAALLTGRNHHNTGTGVIMEMATGYPGYTGTIPKSTGLIAETLRENGYATAAFGKWHNTPEHEVSPAGPFDHWPTGLGFDYFFGFNAGVTDQYYPILSRNTVMVKAIKTPEQGYHFTTDMTDETINWLNNVEAAAPDKPWFVYYAPGAVHAPHHAPKEWRDMFKGKFDYGWDKQREMTYARQLEMGIIPQGTLLTPRPEGIPAWETLSTETKHVYAREMEVYAAYMAHADNEIGRLIQSLDTSGQLENTLIFAILGDNGASYEGGLEGTISGTLGSALNDVARDPTTIDLIGAPGSEPQASMGWSWAMDAPFQWGKEVASHYGGTRNPLIVHWPSGIKAEGEVRTQWHHLIDVVPTILEATGIPQPDFVNGIEQKPLDGVSMMYAFDDASAKDRHTTQYFEMMGNRAIYHDGWVAASIVGPPWDTAGVPRGELKDAKWELYHVAEDFSQANDLAAAEPEKLKELQRIFDEEARKNNVYPIDVRRFNSERSDPTQREFGPPKTSWTYFGNNVQMSEAIGPKTFPRANSVEAELTVPDDGAAGVIAAVGASYAGWSLYIQNDVPVFRYKFFGFEETRITGSVPIPKGKVTISTEFTPDGGKGGSGTLKLYVNGQPAGEGKLTVTSYSHGGEPFEVGRDSYSPVDPAYEGKGEFPFTGSIDKITFRIAS